MQRLDMNERSEQFTHGCQAQLDNLSVKKEYYRHAQIKPPTTIIDVWQLNARDIKSLR